jgi:hypothetical protein
MLKKIKNEEDLNEQKTLTIDLYEELSVKIKKSKHKYLIDNGFNYIYELISDYFIDNNDKLNEMEEFLNELNSINLIPSIYSLLFYKNVF